MENEKNKKEEIPFIFLSLTIQLYQKVKDGQGNANNKHQSPDMGL